MYRALVVSILAVGGAFLGLTFAIVFNKMWREAVRSWRRTRRAVLEPAVLAFAHGDHASLLPALGGQVSRGDRRALEEVLLDHLERVRGIARRRLGRALDELGYVDEYLAALTHRDWWRRAGAAEKLGIACAGRASAALSAALHDEVHEVRLRAARSLGALGGIAAVLPLIEALGQPNRWSTIRVADVLSSIGPAVADEIMAAFPALNLHARIAAIDILGSSRAMNAAPWLRERLRDDEPDVRARACCALGAIDGPETGAALLRALDDPQWSVRAMAARALGRIRYERAIPALCRALRDRRFWVRANAARALRVMGDPGLQALTRMIGDHDGFARQQAVSMLEEAGILDEAVDGMASPDGERREAARALVQRVLGAGRRARVEDHAQRHPDPRVRTTLSALLAPSAVPESVTP